MGQLRVLFTPSQVRADNSLAESFNATLKREVMQNTKTFAN